MFFLAESPGFRQKWRHSLHFYQSRKPILNGLLPISPYRREPIPCMMQIRASCEACILQNNRPSIYVFAGHSSGLTSKCAQISHALPPNFGIGSLRNSGIFPTPQPRDITKPVAVPPQSIQKTLVSMSTLAPDPFGVRRLSLWQSLPAQASRRRPKTCLRTWRSDRV